MIDLSQMRDDLEREIDWDFVEREGANVIRFDMGDNSVWVHSSGEIEGLKSVNVKIQNIMKRVIKATQIG